MNTASAATFFWRISLDVGGRCRKKNLGKKSQTVEVESNRVPQDRCLHACLLEEDFRHSQRKTIVMVSKSRG
ncbi:hypothetical protein HanRHA438_Chr06g0257091 [Helianthus annuus]|nr:hypothetical protein HanRHA438_Chr06g0257091 [Helianthus annuus]